MLKKSVSIVLIHVLIVVLLTSCASKYEVVRPYDKWFQNTLESGDTVRIVTKDGRDLEFPIVFITSEAIVGEEQQVLFTEIAEVKKMEVSAVMTVRHAVWGAWLVFLVIIFALL